MWDVFGGLVVMDSGVLGCMGVEAMVVEPSRA